MFNFVYFRDNSNLYRTNCLRLDLRNIFLELLKLHILYTNLGGISYMCMVVNNNDRLPVHLGLFHTLILAVRLVLFWAG